MLAIKSTIGKIFTFRIAFDCCVKEAYGWSLGLVELLAGETAKSIAENLNLEVHWKCEVSRRDSDGKDQKVH